MPVPISQIKKKKKQYNGKAQHIFFMDVNYYIQALATTSTKIDLSLLYYPTIGTLTQKATVNHVTYHTHHKQVSQTSVESHYESLTNTSQVPPVHNSALAPQYFRMVNAACYKLAVEKKFYNEIIESSRV